MLNEFTGVVISLVSLCLNKTVLLHTFDNFCQDFFALNLREVSSVIKFELVSAHLTFAISESESN